MKILCTLALILACSPAYSGEKAAAAAAKEQPAVSQKKDSAKPEKAKATTKEKKSMATLHKVTKEELGKEEMCPVTGEKFKVAEDTLAADYKGKTYFFCCPGCDKPFLANPEKYLSKKKAEHAKVYVCPMGDYQGDKPGKCPKCGMNLVEKK